MRRVNIRCRAAGKKRKRRIVTRSVVRERDHRNMCKAGHAARSARASGERARMLKLRRSAVHLSDVKRGAHKSQKPVVTTVVPAKYNCSDPANFRQHGESAPEAWREGSKTHMIGHRGGPGVHRQQTRRAGRLPAPGDAANGASMLR